MRVIALAIVCSFYKYDAYGGLVRMRNSSNGKVDYARDYDADGKLLRETQGVFARGYR